MTIIDGIGDEVVHFFLIISIVFVVGIAWATTDIRQQWNIRTVYLLDRRRMRRSRAQRLTNHMESATISEGMDPVEGTSTVEEVPETQTENDEGAASKPEESSGSDSREESSHGSEEEEIVEAMDGDEEGESGMAGLRRRRLTFFQNRNQLFLHDFIDGNEAGSESTPVDRATETSEPQNIGDSNESSITIKLKYINDDLKVVDGRLEEMLGDFKRRHFELELSSNKLVRLIFNGQVLQRDSETLRSYGMFNNCVVHCLVHQNRAVNNQSETAEGERNNNNNNNSQREWDLGNLLIATISFCLGSAWYFRYQYPQLFTVTTTIGLVALTGIFSWIFIGIYFPEFQNRQRPETVNR